MERTKHEGLSDLQIGHRKESKRSPVVEDYLEIIHALITGKGYARVTDIAQHIDASPPTVTKMLQRLHEDGFLLYEKYRGVVLTEKGEVLAKGVVGRHNILMEFLRLLDVDDGIAMIDVCSSGGLEHHLHDETLKAIERLVKFAKANPDWIRRLHVDSAES